MSNWMIAPKSDDLLHFGVPRRSGRYPYGSGDRPYQSTGGKKPRGLFKKFRAKRLAKKQAKAREEAQRKVQEAEALKRSFEKAKEQAIQAGDTQFLYKVRSQLSDDDIRRAIARAEQINKLKPKTSNSGGSGSQGGSPSYSNSKKPKTLKEKFPKFDQFTNNVSTANNWLKTYVNMYGTVNEVMKIIGSLDGGSKPQPQQSQKKKVKHSISYKELMQNGEAITTSVEYNSYEDLMHYGVKRRSGRYPL